MLKTQKISKRKQEILNAASVLFRYKGYAACTMRDLAEKVGLEVSSLYSHIKSKEEILSALCFQCADLYSEGLSQINVLDVDALQKIDAIIDLHINIAIDHPSSITVFNDEWKHLPETDLVLFLNLRKEYEKNIQSIIAEGIQNQIIKNHSVQILMNIILSSMRWIHYSNHSFNSNERSNIQRVVKNTIRDGIAVRPL